MRGVSGQGVLAPARLGALVLAALRAVEHVGPFVVRLRRAEAEIPDGRSGEGDRVEPEGPVFLPQAPDRAAVGSDDDELRGEGVGACGCAAGSRQRAAEGPRGARGTR